MNKAYISIIIDDNNTELSAVYGLVTELYGFPLCAAVYCGSYDKELNHNARPESLELLHKIEDGGGEILSHTLTHKVFNSSVPWDEVDYQLGESYRRLTAEGFEVNGVILAGGGGTEDITPEYREKVEKYTSKYYKYSDLYGVSSAYYNPRTWLYQGLDNTKKSIDKAIEENKWIPIAAHGLNTEIEPLDFKTWKSFLDYLKEKQDAGELEVITYKEAFEKKLF